MKIWANEHSVCFVYESITSVLRDTGLMAYCKFENQAQFPISQNDCWDAAFQLRRHLNPNIGIVRTDSSTKPS